MHRVVPVILFVSLCSTIICPGQNGPTTYDAFQLQNGELYWKNKYEFKGTAEELQRALSEFLRTKSFTSNVIRNENGFYGELRNFKVDCKRYGRRYFNTPHIYWDGYWSGKFKLEAVPNGYQVVVYWLFVEQNSTPAPHARKSQVTKGPYVDFVTDKDKSSLKKSELHNLLLMSLNLKDEFDLAKSAPPAGVRDKEP